MRHNCLMDMAVFHSILLTVNELLLTIILVTMGQEVVAMATGVQSTVSDLFI